MIRIECSDAVAVVPQLLDEARLVWPTVRGVGRINEGTADARLCLYLPDGHAPVTSEAWAAVVAAHVPATPPVEITLAEVAEALRDPLANLTASSASTTVRTAILNQRAALDALLAALETP